MKLTDLLHHWLSQRGPYHDKTRLSHGLGLAYRAIPGPVDGFLRVTLSLSRIETDPSDVECITVAHALRIAAAAAHRQIVDNSPLLLTSHNAADIVPDRLGRIHHVRRFAFDLSPVTPPLLEIPQ